MRQHRDYETITVDSQDFAVSIDYDDTMGAPWEWSDSHGYISDWTSRPKRPGERILARDGSGYHVSYRYYDIQGSVKLARSEWGFTSKRAAAEAVERDFERMRQWCNDIWWWVTVEVAPIDEDEDPDWDASETVGGVESDCWEDIARELAREIVHNQRDEAREATFALGLGIPTEAVR